MCDLILQLVHEVAHALVAARRGIKLAPSFLIPNSQLGTFGSVTQVLGSLYVVYFCNA